MYDGVSGRVRCTGCSVQFMSRARPKGMTVRQRWDRLSQRDRRLIMAGVAAETALKVAMLVDLKRRSASQVRGPKWLWASSVLVNSAGIVPAGYFLVGRR
jgi:hypothetical protein